MPEHAYAGTDNLEVMKEARNYNAFLLDLVMRSATDWTRTIDFGAGIGTFAEMVRERAGIDITCIETDERQRATLRAKGFDAFGNLDALPDGCASFIYSLNVLEHIEDDASAFALLGRKLRPGGRLLIYVPAFEVLFSSMDRKVGHFRRYRRSRLLDLAREARLRVIAARYADSLGWLAALLYRALGPDSGDIDRQSVVMFDRLVFPVSRAVDTLAGRIAGKNVYMLAEKRAVP